jgi:glycosyltransferase involved in cell wall biosynthesis
MKPLISIVIPTYNSIETIEKVLVSIKRQSLDSRKYEVLVIDGGSKDGTIELAKKYGCVIIDNPKQHQVYAKHIGHFKSKARYVMHLDSDEVLENKNSLKVKLDYFKSRKDLVAIVPSGHKTPVNLPSVNNLINDFGDPFSFYMYGYSFNHNFFIDQIKNNFESKFENKEIATFVFDKNIGLPGIEMSASGMVVDKDYVNKIMPKLKNSPHLVSQSYFYIVENNGEVGFTKNDPIVHYSASSWNKYFKKLRSRVINNVFSTEMGKSAFSGRLSYYSTWFSLKRYLFIPYSLLLIPSLITSIKLTISRKNLVYMSFSILCIYISIMILYYQSLKYFGNKVQDKGYGI